MAAQAKAKIPPSVADNGAGRLVPYELCQATVQMLLQVPVANGYILAKRWEEVCPELFQAQQGQPNS